MPWPPPDLRRQFASDNYAAVCPEAMAAFLAANQGHSPAYGADPWTAEATRLIRELFETDCEVFFVFTGTAANSLSLATLRAPFDSALCHETAHIIADECGAPGFFAHGAILETLPGQYGKISAESVEHGALQRRDIHHSRARAVSLTQSTEMGTVYSVAEVAAIAEASRRHGLSLHMDGARFANAVAALGANPAEVTWKAGVDVLSLGGAKNGLPFGEAVVFFRKQAAEFFEYRRKQSAQLASKMRFLAAPWIGVLENGAWLRHAAHANAMASRLETGLRALRGVEIAYPRQANAVFAQLPKAMETGLHERGWHFYSDVSPHGAARLMCSWDITAEDVDSFLRDAAGLAD